MHYEDIEDIEEEEQKIDLKNNDQNRNSVDNYQNIKSVNFEHIYDHNYQITDVKNDRKASNP